MNPDYSLRAWTKIRGPSTRIHCFIVSSAGIGTGFRGPLRQVSSREVKQVVQSRSMREPHSV
jgi:hypothetical protein